MLDTLDATRLRVFREVATRGSFTAAAAHLQISQPAVSQHIAKLEQDTGMSLLDRSTRPLRITDPGLVLLTHADVLLAQLDQARRELCDLAAQDTGRLRLATFPSAAATLVPALIGAFHRELPNVTLQLHEADPPASLPQLRKAEYDAVLAYDYPLLGIARDPDLRWHILAHDSMALALPPGDPLADQAEISLADLRDRPFVAPHPCVCRDALTYAARRAGYTPSVVAETNDYLAMLGMVCAGFGVALIPRLVAPYAPQAVTLRPLARGRLYRTVAVVTRRRGYAPPSLTTLTRLAQQVAPTLGGAALPLDGTAVRRRNGAA